jgi:hypothetical protein
MSEYKYVPPSLRDPALLLQQQQQLQKQLPAINASAKTVAAVAVNTETGPLKYVPPSLRSQQEQQKEQTFDEMFPVSAFVAAAATATTTTATKKFSYANLFSKKAQEEIELKIEELEESHRITIVDTSDEPYENEPTQWSSLKARRAWWLAREKALKVWKHVGRGPLFEVGDSGDDDVELVSHPSEEYTEVSSQGEYSEEISVEGYDTD